MSFPVRLPAPRAVEVAAFADHGADVDNVIVEDDSSSDDDNDDNDNNDDSGGSDDDDEDEPVAGRDEWGSVDTGNTFSSLNMVMM